MFLAFLWILAVGRNFVGGGVLVEPCVDKSGLYHYDYHAPPRHVPLPINVDPEVRLGFLQLFRRAFNAHTHLTPQEEYDLAYCASIDPETTKSINNLASPSAHFSGFFPNHSNATSILTRAFQSQRDARELLKVARETLHQHQFNPRVWFNSLLGAIRLRNRFSGYYLPTLSDVMPDRFLPNNILRFAIAESTARPEPTLLTETCTTAIGVLVKDVKLNQTGPQSEPGFHSRKKRHTPKQNKGWTPELKAVEIPYVFEIPKGFEKEYHKQFDYALILPKIKYVDPIAEGKIELPYTEEIYINGTTARPPRPYDARCPQTTTPYYGWESSEDQSEDQFTSSTPPTTPLPESTTVPSTSTEKPQNRSCIMFNGTSGSTPDINKLWYFREDSMANEYHWYWHHFNNPISPTNPDRRGELFYFAHHNIISRYQAEKLSNSLPMDTPLELRIGGNIGEGYSSGLVDYVSGTSWCPRLDNMPLSDIVHTNDTNFGLDVPILMLTQLYTKILTHTLSGYLVANGTSGPFPLDLKNTDGIAHLSNSIESADEYSANAELYDDLGIHKLGHIAIALATDPNYKCELPPGVMNDESVAMRDPAFFKIHATVDSIINEHKKTLDPYKLGGGDWPLIWEGVNLVKVEMITEQLGRGSNLVKTFWSIKRFRLEEGVDGLIHEGDVEKDICHQHLNHEEFKFRLTIDRYSCANTVSGKATVRLFMAPRYDVDGRRFTMEEERKLMFQMDMFPIELREGRNTITRNSRDSELTRPWSRTLEERLNDPANNNETEYCGCGWPSHLFLPKGKETGMHFDLFAIITNYDDDQVLEPTENLAREESCNSPFIFCGIPNRRYPDARPMGYPFDRRTYGIIDGVVEREVIDLEEYVRHVPNMQSSVVVIQHVDKIV